MFGAQDVMQRQTLLPLVSQSRNASDGLCFDRKRGPTSILEVACGTGRLSTFVRDNFPAANVTLTDLSPFYLDKAAENDRYWREYRGREAMKESTGVRTLPSPASIVRANAETLPFPDNTFDAVLCVYLFHELPSSARRKAAQEMARVVKQGGMVVLSDSIQVGDRVAFDNVLDLFTDFNEPHFVNYTQDDLVAMFTDHGLECDEKYITSRTKTLSFIKPKLS
jgi:ubiquinone/menaquinone biosynthesis C-methylase UbiE